MRTSARIVLSSLLFAGVAASPLAAAAAAPASTVDEVVVTATKRAENVQSVPISITALGQQTLEKIGADKLDDYTRMAPGLVYASNGANSGTFEIRGVNTSTLAGNTQSPVAIYYDDLPALNSYAPLVTTDLRLFDVSRVEVLRGPQGTLFGSGALGGAIRVITNKPDASGFAAKTEATVSGTEDGEASYALSGMINAPLASDKLALRAVAYWRRDGGWVDNVATGEKDQNSSESYGGRVMLGAQLSERLHVLATVGYQHDDPDDAAYSFYAGPARQYDNLASQRAAQKGTTWNLVADYHADFADVTSSTTYVDQDQYIARDYSKVAAGAFGLSGPGPIEIFGPSKVFAQELRIASPQDQRFRWLVGGFYMHNDRRVNEQLYMPGAGAVLAPFGFPSDYLFDAHDHILSSEEALFGEANFDLTPQLTLTAGARVFRNSLHVTDDADGIFAGGPSHVDRALDESSTTPRFVLSYKLTPQVMFYAQAAKGYRIGQTGLAPPVDPVSGLPVPSIYGPDSLWNYEGGVKSTLLDGKLTFNAAGYYIDWTDIQLQNRSAAGFVYIVNAGKARSQGLEIEARLRPTDNIELGTALSFNDTRLNSVAPGVIATVGDQLPGAPKFTAANYVEFHFAPPWGEGAWLRLDHQYFGKAYSDLNNSTALTFGDFNVFNARLGVDFGKVELVGFVDNIGDSNGRQNAVFLPAGPSAVRLRPRTFGVTARASF